MTDIEVVDRDEAGRYEVLVDGALAGYADRIVDGTVMVLPHTVVDPRFRGRGLAATLVERALADARERSLTVDPQCWYVAQYIDSHPDEQDLLAKSS